MAVAGCIQNSETLSKYEQIFLQFVSVHQTKLKYNSNFLKAESVFKKSRLKRKRVQNEWVCYFNLFSIVIIVISVIVCSLLSKSKVLDSLVENTLGVRCVLPNNYFLWEATRPVTNCEMCKNLTHVRELFNSSREEFADFAYTSQPTVIRQAAAHWQAAKVLSFNYFKNLFESIEGSYASIEDECQFLSFKTEFLSLRDVFNMRDERLNGEDGEKPWYVGWSVCLPEMVKRMREFYPRPHFLPEDAEHSHLDYVFMGYQQGAVMHLDYISRLMWQAQLIGRKKWQLVPPPECDHICSPLSVTVEEGDIFILDTRQWYHDTFVEAGLFSLTISSEYG